MHRCHIAAALLTAAGAASAAEPVGGLKSGVYRTNMDQSVRPQDDLFRHVNGKWLSGSAIPADRSLDGAFYGLVVQSEKDRRAIVEGAAKPGEGKSPEEKKIGDLFNSFMDEAAAERAGLDPIKPELEIVAGVSDKRTLLSASAKLERVGVAGPFNAYVDIDPESPTRYTLNLSQGGIGLLDEYYYREPKFKSIREAYLAHVRKTFELARVPNAAEAANHVFALETRLAKNHWDRVKSRDRTLTYNKTKRSDLPAGIDWTAWFEATGLSAPAEVVVRQPSYLKALVAALDEVPVAHWKEWLRWQVLRKFSPLLNKALVDEDFSFYGRTLTGSPQIKPRWNRGVAVVEGALGEALGKLYVAKHFPPAAKERAEKMIENLKKAYAIEIQSLDWMSETTKKKALEKLGRFRAKIAYPSRWRDYSGLEIRGGDLVGDLRRAAAFQHEFDSGKLSRPVDREEWGMTPQTVNAYYNAGRNEIVFPAAILQPPFFDFNADDAVNYGGLGSVIGHEISHGFDDQGSKFDGGGFMIDWWTAQDRKRFMERAQKLIQQYNGFEPSQLKGQRVNGALTIGENIADLCGVSISHLAYRLSLGGKPAPVLDGLTGDQRFFISWGQVWRAKYRDEELSRRLTSDVHSPAEFRCNGVVRNVPAFHEAFGVKEGDRLFLPPEKRVKIW